MPINGIPKSRTEQMHDGHIRLYPSATSTDSGDMWISLIAYGIALGLWLWLAVPSRNSIRASRKEKCPTNEVVRQQGGAVTQRDSRSFDVCVAR